MASPFPLGVSGLIDPDDESSIAFLESCAAIRRRLGLPSYSREELEQFFHVKDAPAPPPRPGAAASKVISLDARRRVRRS